MSIDEIVEKISDAMSPKWWNESEYGYSFRQAKAIYHALSGVLVPREEKEGV